MANRFFCFGSDDSWRNARERARDGALAAGFDYVHCFTADNIAEWRHAEWAKTTRGWGFWGWKPWLALRVLATASDGDTITYADSGSFIRPKKWNVYWDRANRTDGVFFFHQHPEHRYCKADLWAKHRSLPVTPTGDRFGQIWAGAWILPVKPSTKSLLTDWAAHWDDLHMVDDSPSLEPNHPDFIEHRHDQAVLSLLVKARCSPDGFLSEDVECYREDSPVYAARHR